jgi:hypothetical protein
MELWTVYYITTTGLFQCNFININSEDETTVPTQRHFTWKKLIYIQITVFWYVKSCVSVGRYTITQRYEQRESMKLRRYLTYAWTFVCACVDLRNTFIYVLSRDTHNVQLYSVPSWKICGWLIIETATVHTHVTQSIHNFIHNFYYFLTLRWYK